jgi:hypothetical protein
MYYAVEFFNLCHLYTRDWKLIINSFIQIILTACFSHTNRIQLIETNEGSTLLFLYSFYCKRLRLSTLLINCFYYYYYCLCRRSIASSIGGCIWGMGDCNNINNLLDRQYRLLDCWQTYSFKSVILESRCSSKYENHYLKKLSKYHKYKRQLIHHTKLFYHFDQVW